MQDQAEHESRGRPIWLMVTLFVLVAALLQWGWSEARGTSIERAVIDVATVDTAVAIINAWTPNVNAHAVGPSIKAPGGGINILNGCEGTEVLFLFVAALTAYPFSWRTRLGGLLVGSVFIFMANQMRLLALFYSYQNDRALFDELHGLVMPLVLVMVTLALFVWLMHLDDRLRRTRYQDLQA